MGRYFLIFLLMFLAACSGVDTEVVEEKDPTAEEFYAEGKRKLEDGFYKTAIEKFEEIERLYPFSPLATKAQVMIAYSYYKNEDFDDAIMLIDKFIRLNPGNADIAYVYYLKALCFYDRISDIKRDQELSRQALISLKEVIKRFPDSEYSRDSKLKIDLVTDHLAGKEMEIGRFYLKDKKYIAAINRFKSVVEKYDTTSQVEEALYRLTESYLSLGLIDEAQKSASILGYNYPNSKWYKYAYRLVGEGKNSPKPLKKKSWFKKMISKVKEEEEEEKEE